MTTYTFTPVPDAPETVTETEPGTTTWVITEAIIETEPEVTEAEAARRAVCLTFAFARAGDEVIRSGNSVAYPKALDAALHRTVEAKDPGYHAAANLLDDLDRELPGWAAFSVADDARTVDSFATDACNDWEAFAAYRPGPLIRWSCACGCEDVPGVVVECAYNLDGRGER